MACSSLNRCSNSAATSATSLRAPRSSDRRLRRSCIPDADVTCPAAALSQAAQVSKASRTAASCCGNHAPTGVDGQRAPSLDSAQARRSSTKVPPMVSDAQASRINANSTSSRALAGLSVSAAGVAAWQTARASRTAERRAARLLEGHLLTRKRRVAPSFLEPHTRQSARSPDFGALTMRVASLRALPAEPPGRNLPRRA